MSEIEILLESGADVNTSDKNNFTLLMNFVNKGDKYIVKMQKEEEYDPQLMEQIMKHQEKMMKDKT